MAIKIGGAKPKASPPKDNPKTDDTMENLGTGAATETAPLAGFQASPPKQQASFLMTGEQQKTAVDQVKAAQDLRTKLRGGIREFWLNPGEFANLYFLDGALISEGVFNTPMTATHMLQISGDWVKFICNKNTEGDCVVCDSNGDGSHVTTVQLFTVINTMPYTIKNGQNKGKVLPARLQMLAVPNKIRDILLKRAANNGGSLAGKMFSFSRATKQDARTGNDIEFIAEYPMGAVLQKYPMLSGPNSDQPTEPINYNEAYPILTNAEIAALRPDIGSMAGWVSPNAAPTFAQQAGMQLGDIGDDEIPF